VSTNRSGNGLVGMLGKLALQLLGPAIAAAVASYVAVASQLVRLEERIESLRTEMQLRYGYIERDISGLKKADERLSADLTLLREKGRSSRAQRTRVIPPMGQPATPRHPPAFGRPSWCFAP
jgi:predicted  nucleic acid-binding Zn-ribbon protein